MKEFPFGWVLYIIFLICIPFITLVLFKDYKIIFSDFAPAIYSNLISSFAN